MSHVYIVTQTSYKDWNDFENEENKDLEILEVYTALEAANHAAAQWVEESCEDGENECEEGGNGCKTWTCRFWDRDESHIVISVVEKALLGEVDDSEEEEEEGEHEEEESKENQEPPAKRAREA